VRYLYTLSPRFKRTSTKHQRPVCTHLADFAICSGDGRVSRGLISVRELKRGHALVPAPLPFLTTCFRKKHRLVAEENMEINAAQAFADLWALLCLGTITPHALFYRNWYGVITGLACAACAHYNTGDAIYALLICMILSAVFFFRAIAREIDG